MRNHYPFERSEKVNNHLFFKGMALRVALTGKRVQARGKQSVRSKGTKNRREH